MPDQPRVWEFWKKRVVAPWALEHKSYRFSSVDISTLKVHDVVEMRIKSSVPNHLAVYLGNGMLLHHLWGRIAQQELLSKYQPFVTTIYRYDGNIQTTRAA
jgi:cell wall-associated NlpC family hydrolase